jgi:hypothetical protein
VREGGGGREREREKERERERERERRFVDNYDEDKIMRIHRLKKFEINCKVK